MVPIAEMVEASQFKDETKSQMQLGDVQIIIFWKITLVAHLPINQYISDEFINFITINLVNNWHEIYMESPKVGKKSWD